MLTHSHQIFSEDAIPYREDVIRNVDDIMDYLTYSWIGKGWVHVSERVRDAIAGKMWEIYNNSFEHSQSRIGVFTCGHYYKAQNELVLSTIDFGKGISANVKEFINDNFGTSVVSQFIDGAALKWALLEGTTTSNDTVARGLGLSLLKDFIQLNNGKLEIYSNNDYACINSNGEKYCSYDINFPGTIVHITLICDEYLYKFSDE